MSRPIIGNEESVFTTCALQVISRCVDHSTPVVYPQYSPVLKDGEFSIILNIFANQCRLVDQLTMDMPDHEACNYLRDKTNEQLLKMSRGGDSRIGEETTPFGQVLPSVRLTKVDCLHEDTGRRRFIGIGVGTVAIF